MSGGTTITKRGLRRAPNEFYTARKTAGRSRVSTALPSALPASETETDRLLRESRALVERLRNALNPSQG